MPSLVGPSVSIKGTAAAVVDPDIDWVHEIVALVKGHTYTGPLVGDSQQEHMEKYEQYKRDVFKTIQFSPGPNPTIVAAMIAIQYLTGNARKAVLKFCLQQPLEKMVSMNEVFDELGENVHIVVSEEYYLMLELLDHDLLAKRMLRRKDILQLLCIKSNRAAQRKDRINGVILCRELQDFKEDLKARLFGHFHRTCPNLSSKVKSQDFCHAR
jgi:hypothetical protein